MKNSKNEFIRKRRRKKRRRKIIFTILFLSAILVTLSIKLPYFKIQNIYVYNNKTISTSEIVKESGVQKNSNIFYISTANIKDNVLNNPYILSAEIHRKLPNSINIYVNERKSVFYAEKGTSFAIIDKSGIVLEIRNSINNMKLIKLVGIDTSKAKVGATVPLDDKGKLNTISTITDIISNNDACKNIKILDITSNVNIKLSYNDMEIRLGTDDDLLKKLNRAINIINGEKLTALKGYVDVSFTGNPVYSIDK
ncbi:cell division protein FtsQ/DivIB [Clostridium akagii]|uniref:cell division protein FtsQ/DivIB n=1 Tax=Clostridium akagii TaxID=91623 RepID=UPI00047B2DB6|nr:FtsQ-type POTRA domain-containing protein [Clostridium akagii]